MIKTRIGRHISTGNNFVALPQYAKNIGCNVFQIFLGSPKQIITKSKNKNDLINIGKELIKYDIEMVIHGSYIINFCNPIDSVKHKNSIRALVQDLNSSHLIGSKCYGVIIHMGKNIKENNITDTDALNNYILGIKKSLELSPPDTTIILETGASQGTEIASKIDGMADIYNSLDKNERARVKFCIDTCHIWATGYDISSKDGIKNFFRTFDKKIGIDKICCIHFNDSKNTLDAHIDRHADLGYGFIGNTGLSFFARVANRFKIPIIMETPLDSVVESTNKDIVFGDEQRTVINWIQKINN